MRVRHAAPFQPLASLDGMPIAAPRRRVAALLVDAILTGAVPLVRAISFWSAARFEERTFGVSAHAEEYEAYRRRTGRFVPRL